MEIVNGVPFISIDEICWCCDMTRETKCTQKDCMFYNKSGDEMMIIVPLKDEKDEN